MKRKALWLVPLAWWALAGHAPQAQARRLSNQEFWALSQSLSESGDALHTSYLGDNLVTNETGFQSVLPGLAARHPSGGAYLGVGPEQNFTYIAATQPEVSFIIDIRRENRDLQLMYKALFGLTRDRVEFLSMLFSRPLPDGLDRSASLLQLMQALSAAAPDDAMSARNIARITTYLREMLALPLQRVDIESIEWIFARFRQFGPDITYTSVADSNLGMAPGSSRPSDRYERLMLATGSDGREWSFLSSPERFEFVKQAQARNLVVPVVANFAGPSALRAIGDWLRAHDLSVSAFYISNVETYLRPPNVWDAFCRNVLTLPVTETSEFIRAGSRELAPNAERDRIASHTVELRSCRCEVSGVRPDVPRWNAARS